MLEVPIWTEINLLYADLSGSKPKTNRRQGGSNTTMQKKNWIVRMDAVQTSWGIYCWVQSYLEEVSSCILYYCDVFSANLPLSVQ